ncbi:hypothetical protein HF086_005667 [Spodoptera exigua]|uniref:Uncharacterized protein n=1 Tax=Spodoptera exigua TaxID=7107 RepID=A0A922SNM1_SPOEX|nr:hypothetical protein HF086_005667 [Spodoptera exigua]
MNKEEPSFNKCCFCFPLRYGLLVWGNLKISVAAFFITTTSYALLSLCMMFRLFGTEEMRTRFHRDVALTSVALTFFVMDFFVNIVFIIGGYKVRLFLIPVKFCFLLKEIIYFYTKVHNKIIDSIFTVVQTYFLLLLKSEIIKLNYGRDVQLEDDTTLAKRKRNDSMAGNDTDSVESEDV